MQSVPKILGFIAEMTLLKAKISKRTMGSDRIFPTGPFQWSQVPTAPILRGWLEGDMKEPNYPMPLQGILCITLLNILTAELFTDSGFSVWIVTLQSTRSARKFLIKRKKKEQTIGVVNVSGITYIVSKPPGLPDEIAKLCSVSRSATDLTVWHTQENSN